MSAVGADQTDTLITALAYGAGVSVVHAGNIYRIHARICRPSN